MTLSCSNAIDWCVCGTKTQLSSDRGGQSHPIAGNLPDAASAPSAASVLDGMRRAKRALFARRTGQVDAVYQE
jgi:hypothetical protein